MGGRAALGAWIGAEAGMTVVTGVREGPEAALVRGGEAGMRFFSAYMGYRVARKPSKPSQPIRKTELLYDKTTGELSAERYFNIFGRKITYAHSKIALQTRGLPDIIGKPSPVGKQPSSFTGINKWYSTTTTAWQPKTGIPLPGGKIVLPAVIAQPLFPVIPSRLLLTAAKPPTTIELFIMKPPASTLPKTLTKTLYDLKQLTMPKTRTITKTPYDIKQLTIPKTKT